MHESSDRPEHHRIFEAALAEPPRMWSTHPSNVDREDNAKRTYITNAIADRSVWDLFVQPDSFNIFRTLAW